MALILASQSPRRRELLGHLNIPFAVTVADIDETMDSALTPADAVADVSRRKALAIDCSAGDTVLAADTVVVCENRILGKPRSQEDAVQMLTLLSGRTHQVMTGMTLVRDGKMLTHTEVTDVTFRPLSKQEIVRYIRTGEPMDKAGAYGIQGGAAVFVQGICGDYFNVVGLPVCRLRLMLEQIAPELFDHATPTCEERI